MRIITQAKHIPDSHMLRWFATYQARQVLGCMTEQIEQIQIFLDNNSLLGESKDCLKNESKDFRRVKVAAQIGDKSCRLEVTARGNSTFSLKLFGNNFEMLVKQALVNASEELMARVDSSRCEQVTNSRQQRVA